MLATPPPTSVRLVDLHVAQQQINRERRRFNVLACGRRFGKTLFGIQRTHKPLLSDGQPVGWFSPTYKLLAEVWREAVTLYAPITANKSVQDHRLELVTGGVLEFWSLDGPDPARGRRYKRVILDEAAMVPHLADAWQMAIRPTLADYQGDAYFLSTPRGLNFFHSLYQAGQDPEETEWASWQMPTGANPYINAEEIEAARLELPERAFAQEYLAAFLADGAGVFRGVEAVSTLKPQEPIPGHAYVFGVDWGKLNDFTAISIIDATTRRQVRLERYNRIDYAFQVEHLRTLANLYKPRTILAERNSIGEPLIEHLMRFGLPVQPWLATNQSKAEVIESLALAIERADVTLLDDPAQRGELLAYDADRLPSGLLRYGAPSGMHDDTVMALALSWDRAKVAPLPSRIAYTVGSQPKKPIGPGDPRSFGLRATYSTGRR